MNALSSFVFLGPKGPSLISVHSDNTRIHGLEKKVVRLEDKVTVLETAMAGLARRILDVEQNTGLNYTSFLSFPSYFNSIF